MILPPTAWFPVTFRKEARVPPTGIATVIATYDGGVTSVTTNRHRDVAFRAVS